MKSKLFTCLAMLFVSFSLMAQTRSVSGKVTASSDGQPLAGVAVTIEGNKAAYAITDLDGKYAIDAKNGDVLTFTMMGYATQTSKVGTASVYDVVLKDDTMYLEETVVIGYGTVRKKDLTGSVASVNSDKLKETIATNVDQMLQGKVAGVQITANSGAPGAASSIRVRGANSINNSNEPLYIIDGIPFSGSGNSISGFDWYGGSNGQNVVNPLSTISPADIVSIDVLKDASATAIYGANGANGVIIITTRRGSAGKVNISYDGYVTAQMITNRLDMMNLREYAEYQAGLCEDLNQPLNNYYKDPSLLGAGTDWQDEVFRTAWMHSHSISVTGGTEKIRVAASGGYTDQDGVIIGSSFERFNGRLNADFDVRPWLHAGASLAFTHTDEVITNNDGGSGVVLQALTMQPSVPVYDFDGNFAGPDTVYGSSTYNPVWLAMMMNNNYKRNRTMGNFYLSVDPVKGLNLRTEFGFDSSDNTNTSFVPTYEYGMLGNETNKMLYKDDHSMYWIWKTYANYNKTWAGKHNFGAMAGWEMTRSSWNGHTIIKTNFSTDDIFVMTQDGRFSSNNGWKDSQTMASAFARLNYNYDERYYATVTFRADASSKFGANKKWGFFPSAALAWRISQEPFFEPATNVMNEFKLRLGYGQVGNSNINSYLYSSKMNSATSYFGTAYYMANIANPNLHWEASEQYNVGLDLEFLKGRIALTVDGYYKKSKGLLLEMSVPTYLGGNGDMVAIRPPMVNMGQTSNKGFDLNLTTRNIERKIFSWTSNLVFSLNRNMVDSMNSDSSAVIGKVDWYPAFQTATRIQVGQPMGVFYGYIAEGLFTSAEDILASPVQLEDPANPGVNLVNEATGVWPGDIKFKDLDGNGVIDENDQTIIGDPNPDFTLGFTNTFTIGDFDINIALNASVGGDILNFSRNMTEGVSSLWDNQLVTVLDRARVQDGKLVEGTGYSQKYGYLMPRATSNDFNQNKRMSTRWIEDGSYLRIQNVSIGYRLPSKVLEKTKLASFKVYVNAQNLYTFTKYSGYDPEIGAYNQSSLYQNIDRGRYPTPMAITLGVNIGF